MANPGAGVGMLLVVGKLLGVGMLLEVGKPLGVGTLLEVGTLPVEGMPLAVGRPPVEGNPLDLEVRMVARHQLPAPLSGDTWRHLVVVLQG